MKPTDPSDWIVLLILLLLSYLGYLGFSQIYEERLEAQAQMDLNRWENARQVNREKWERARSVNKQLECFRSGYLELYAIDGELVTEKAEKKFRECL